MLPEIVGKKIRFISTDRSTELKKGDIATIKDISIIENKFGGIANKRGKRTDKRVIEVVWQNGSNLSLVEGIDEFQILDRLRNNR
jgi:hypothetical protein